MTRQSGTRQSVGSPPSGAAIGARLWWGLVPLILLLWATGALVVSALPGLPATPWATLLLVPGLDFARDVAVAVAAGAVVVRLLTTARSVRPWAVGWSLSAAALAALALGALHADITGTGVDRTDAGVSIAEVALGTLAGRALVVQAACLLAAAAVSALASGLVGRAIAAGLVLAAAAAPGIAGHAGLSGEHAAAAVAIGLHAAAASAWIGGLAVVTALLVREPARAAEVLPRFSGLALACVIVVAESGLLTTSLTAGGVSDLLGTAYGSLVVAKAALLGWLVLLGWQQRRQVVDRVASAGSEAPAGIVRTMVAIAGIELLVMGGVLAAAVVLSRIGPSPIPGEGFAPLTLVVLGLAVPMLVVAVRPRGWRVTDALPEVAAVLLVVVMVEVGGVGLIRAVLGPLGLAAEVALLVIAGWLAVSAARGAALAILLVGVPAAVGLSTALADRPGTMRMAVVAGLVAVVLIGLWWRARRRSGGAGQEGQPDARQSRVADDDITAGSGHGR